ncbi:c-type cytochrome [Pseudolysobacter antarcticus]|nr:cytochrome c [Pseudolysobacter antarcticus]
MGFVALAMLGAGLTEQQQRGREIFLHGQTDSNHSIDATLGNESTVVPATLLPCANCHGDDAHGKPEGGVRPADITPVALTRSLTLGSRSRPAYTPSLLKRAITMGLDSAGNPLDNAMPHFRLTQQDARDLLAYLDVVGSVSQPGIGDDRIRINVLGADDLVVADASMYGRRIEISRTRDDDAFLTIDTSADSSASIAAATRDGMPTIATYAAQAATVANIFILTASMQDQIAALETYARSINSRSILRTKDCSGTSHIATDTLVLLTSAAAQNCALNSLPAALDQRVIVAAPMPPTPQGNRDAASAALSIATSVLAQLGRDVTRRTFLDALEHIYRSEHAGLAPITWSSQRHVGSKAVWLMKLKLPEQRLSGEPGWVEGE